MSGMSVFTAQKIQILHLPPISLDLKAGQCLSITGDSGCGKSLFLRALADLDLNPGEFFLNGQPSSSYPPWQWRRQVGLLPAESSWWLAKVGDHFPNRGSDFHQELAVIGLPADILTSSTHQLSSGERQRLSLLRLLSNRPVVLLLDEPTANLDEKNSALVEQVLKKYREVNDSILIWVTHDRSQARRVADRHLHFTKNDVSEVKEA